MFLPSNLLKNEEGSPPSGVLRGAANLIKDGMQQTAGKVQQAAASTVEAAHMAATTTAGAMQQAANTTKDAIQNAKEGIAEITPGFGPDYNTISTSPLRLSSEPKLPEDGGFDLRVFDVTSETNLLGDRTLQRDDPALLSENSTFPAFDSVVFPSARNVASTAVTAASSAVESAASAVGGAVASIRDKEPKEEEPKKEDLTEEEIRKREQDKRLQDIMNKRHAKPEGSFSDLHGQNSDFEAHGHQGYSNTDAPRGKQSAEKSPNDYTPASPDQCRSESRPGKGHRTRSPSPARGSEEGEVTRSARQRSVSPQRCESKVTTATSTTTGSARQRSVSPQRCEPKATTATNSTARSRSTTRRPGREASRSRSRSRTQKPEASDHADEPKARRSRSRTHRSERGSDIETKSCRRSRSRTHRSDNEPEVRRSRSRTTQRAGADRTTTRSRSRTGTRPARCRSNTPRSEKADGTKSSTSARTRSRSSTPKNVQADGPELRRSRSTTPRRARSTTPKSDKDGGPQLRRTRTATSPRGEGATSWSRSRSNSPNRSRSGTRPSNGEGRVTRSRSRSPGRNVEETKASNDVMHRSTSGGRHHSKSLVQKDEKGSSRRRTASESPARKGAASTGVGPAKERLNDSDLLDDSLKDGTSEPSTLMADKKPQAPRKPPSRGKPNFIHQGVSGPIQPTGDRFVQRGMSKLLDDSLRDDSVASNV